MLLSASSPSPCRGWKPFGQQTLDHCSALFCWRVCLCWCMTVNSSRGLGEEAGFMLNVWVFIMNYIFADNTAVRFPLKLLRHDKAAQRHHFSDLSLIVKSLRDSSMDRQTDWIENILANAGRESDWVWMIRDNQNHEAPWREETAAQSAVEPQVVHAYFIKVHSLPARTSDTTRTNGIILI